MTHLERVYYQGNILAARKSHRETQGRVAQACGISVTTIVQIEHGRCTNDDTILRVARYLSVPPPSALEDF